MMEEHHRATFQKWRAELYLQLRTDSRKTRVERHSSGYVFGLTLERTRLPCGGLADRSYQRVLQDVLYSGL